MKHLSLFVVFAFTATLCFAQNNIGIGTVSPDASAMLDVTSTSKGMLIPRMTSGQRTGIASPATGLLVFDLNTGSFWFKNSTGWVELTDSLNNLWKKNGSDAILNTSGNVGIGTISPKVKVQINNGTDLSSVTGGFLQLGDSTLANLALDNNEIQARTNAVASNLFLQYNGGNVAMGSVTPLTKLDVNGQITIRGGSPGLDKVLYSDANGTAIWRPAARGTGFFVYKTATQQINNGVVTVVNFPSGYDDGGNYNAANDYFNCPTAGFYHFDMNILFDTPNSFAGDATFTFGFYLNGSILWEGADNIKNLTYTTSHSFSLYYNLAANDHISVRVSQGTGSYQWVRGFFSGYRVY